ncbi:hypothetical protein KFE25_000435 [Diacronema lutheri]|uniref:EF-hand domain-containing protein n=2 Tax=Diacronema lutheri TaxID=2081491 RepID=A0A8J5XV84_DIALT|nr:hypothetical protein KFE25_000435 [Diacronema lutheri]
MPSRQQAPQTTADVASLREEWQKQKEMANLKRVFAMLDSDSNGLIGEKELNRALLRIGCRAKPGETADMIWEVDENCDGFVDWPEFVSMFDRCISDTTGLEPRGLFQLVEFLMHDSNNGGTISRDELMEILYSRFGKDQLLKKTREFFPKAAANGVEAAITFVEFKRFMTAIKPKRKTNRERAQAVLKPGG